MQKVTNRLCSMKKEYSIVSIVPYIIKFSFMNYDNNDDVYIDTT
jgi:hypothetical protein